MPIHDNYKLSEIWPEPTPGSLFEWTTLEMPETLTDINDLPVDIGDTVVWAANRRYPFAKLGYVTKMNPDRKTVTMKALLPRAVTGSSSTVPVGKVMKVSVIPLIDLSE